MVSPDLLQQVDRLIRSRRLLELRIAGERRLIASEDAARYRDGLGIPLPPGLAAALLEPVAHPVLELVRRYARTHGPFTLHEAAERFALDAAAVEEALRQLAHEGRVLEGGFRPGGLHREWCDAEMLRLIRRKSLARLRREVEPVEQHTLARFLTQWQGSAGAASQRAWKSRWTAGCDREFARCAVACLAGGERDFAGAHCGVCAGWTRYADCGGRSGVGGR